MNKIVASIGGSVLALCAAAKAGAEVVVETRLWPVGWSEDGSAALFRFQEQHDDRQIAGFRLLSMHSTERTDVVLSDLHIGRQVVSPAACRAALRDFASTLGQHGFAAVKVEPAACAAERSRALRSAASL